MVARLLITLLTALAWAVPLAAAPQICLECHPAHYVQQGSCTSCHRGDPASRRKNIAHQQLVAGRFARYLLAEQPERAQGQRLIEQYACRRCHVIAGQGNRLAGSLDTAALQRSPQDLQRAIRWPAAGMPDFMISEPASVAVVTALLAGAQTAPGASRLPQVVHFERDTQTRTDLFSRTCGACHRMLTQRRGMLGQGDVAPNLSGLLTRFYPSRYGDGLRWNEARLEQWLRNPRAVRRTAGMQPVLLTADERRQLLTVIMDGAGDGLSGR